MQQVVVDNDGAPPLSGTDGTVIARLAAGDPTALNDLYTGHRAPVLAYLHTLLRDPSLAEEVLQDTLVAAWLGAAAFEHRSSVRVWLLSIARRRAYDTFRRRAVITLDDTALASLPATDPDPESLAIVAAEHADLHAAMHRLRPLHREVLLLNFMHELPYRDIAMILDVPIGTVMSRLHHAKRALRAELVAVSAP